MIVPARVRVESRVLVFGEKSLVTIGFETNDLKNYVVAEIVDMACDF